MDSHKKPFFMAFSLTVSVPASYETSVCPESAHVRFSIWTQGGDDWHVSFLLVFFFCCQRHVAEQQDCLLPSLNMMNQHTHVYVLHDSRHSLTNRCRRIFKNGKIFIVIEEYLSITLRKGFSYYVFLVYVLSNVSL